VLWTFEVAPAGLMATDRMQERTLDVMELCDTLVEMGVECSCYNNPAFPAELICPFMWDGAELELDHAETVSLIAGRAEDEPQMVEAAKALEERLLSPLPSSEVEAKLPSD